MTFKETCQSRRFISFIINLEDKITEERDKK